MLFAIGGGMGMLDTVATSKAAEAIDSNEYFDLMKAGAEAPACPHYIQPDAELRHLFYELKNTLVAQCSIQQNINIRNLVIDLQVERLQDPITGTVSAIYGEFFPDNDRSMTCADVADKMDLICPGILRPIPETATLSSM